jgi:protein O-GlcNAc transferase
MIVLLFAVVACLLARPSQPLASDAAPSVDALLSRAQSLVQQRDSDAAFATLSKIYAVDPDARGLANLFEACLRLRVEEVGNTQDRFGLAALLLDQERYEEASVQLRHILSCEDDPGKGVLEKASSMLFRTNAACCQWGTYLEDSKKLVESLQLSSRGSDPNDVPSVHPFEALKWTCISLAEATQVASLYARRSISSTNNTIQNWDIQGQIQWKEKMPTMTVSRESDSKLSFQRKIRLGYLSPDFTSLHPLAFLMQHVFRHHNRQHFEIKIYSMSRDDKGPEVCNIMQGSDSYTVLPAESPEKLAKQILDDNLDILVDLCGYAGTDRVSQIMSLRPAPIQISYMGFPASSGAPYIDYLVCDPVVVPINLRKFYTENLIWMPHCYFVNSHAMSVSHLLVRSDEKRRELRQENQLPEDAFVYCCHSRPDKIDPATFRTWLGALKRARQTCSAVLWLLRSGSEMEQNLRQIARQEFQIEDEALVFCYVAPRDVHLQRLGCADLFLDTPAYNAHTLGCDTLFAGVPMISLLRPEAKQYKPMDPFFVETDKLASRVGASLLKAAGLEELICGEMRDYANTMVYCATERHWYTSIRNRLCESRLKRPLFDTKRWVENLEVALRQIVIGNVEAADIIVADIRAPIEE